MGCCLSLFFVAWIMKMYFHVFLIEVDNACKTQLCPMVLTPSAQAPLPLYAEAHRGRKKRCQLKRLCRYGYPLRKLCAQGGAVVAFFVTSSLMLFNSVFD